jgi:hypothetical protein
MQWVSRDAAVVIDDLLDTVVTVRIARGRRGLGDDATTDHRADQDGKTNQSGTDRTFHATLLLLRGLPGPLTQHR